MSGVRLKERLKERVQLLGRWALQLPLGTITLCAVIVGAYLFEVISWASVGSPEGQDLCLSKENFSFLRLFTNWVFHSTWIHVLINIISVVWVAPAVERVPQLGTLRFLLLCLLLSVLHGTTYILITFLVGLLPLVPLAALTTTCILGFSGVLFGMMVYHSRLPSPTSMVSIYGLFDVPIHMYPLVLLLLFVLFDWMAIFSHVAGLLAGIFASVTDRVLLPVTAVSFVESSVLNVVSSSKNYVHCQLVPQSLPFHAHPTTGQTTPPMLHPSSFSGGASRSASSPTVDARPHRKFSNGSTFPGEGRQLGSSSSPTRGDAAAVLLLNQSGDPNSEKREDD